MFDLDLVKAFNPLDDLIPFAQCYLSHTVNEGELDHKLLDLFEGRLDLCTEFKNNYVYNEHLIDAQVAALKEEVLRDSHSKLWVCHIT